MTYIPKDPTRHAREKRSKYRNTKCKAGGMKFDSIGERDRYFYLADAERQGKIRNLKTQINYAITVNGHLICHYIADFVYEKDNGDLIVEDYKGGYRLPPDWPIKQKLMRAVCLVDIKIVKKATEPI